MKRAFDIAVSLMLLALALPVIAIIGIGVAVFLGSPVLFKQVRPGLNGKPFIMIKFRTMREASDATGNPLPDSERLTAFGRFLRRTSLDELPGLFNVLKGEMSLVGPRPLLVEYLPLYNIDQRRRHEMKPGITGWAQVNGRNALTWEKKFEYDVWYVDHWTFWLDMKIVGLTMVKVFRGEGIAQEGHVTAERFRGSAP